jgi:hypothetical protein
LIAGRTLAVVRRKLFLLREVEKRLAEFRSAQVQKEELLLELLNHEEPPLQLPALMGVREFLTKHVHKDGNPVDADRCDFQAFASSFGLPAMHKSAASLRREAEEATDWWANQALQRAQDGVKADPIRRILAVVTGINGERNHVALQECNIILGDRLAQETLENAEKIQQRDADTVERSRDVQPDSAKKAAAEINELISDAFAHGAPPKHKCLEKAKSIATALSIEEKARYALKALRFAEDARDRDAAKAAQCVDSIPEVGIASDLADLIEREVTAAVKKGALSEDASLKEARVISKTLRDEDGQRKRMLARHRRLTAKAGDHTE